VTQSRDFLLEKRYTTHQQNCKTIFLFLGFGYKVDVRLFPQSADTSWHAGFISHSISCVTFNRFIIEKALLHIMNMESTSPVKSPLSKGNCPFPPLVAGMVTLQFFQNCVPGISMVFPVCFLVNKNSFRTDITCNLTRHCGLPLL